MLEVAAAHPSISDLRTTVDDALTDTYRIEALVVDLLTLARIDDRGEDGRTGPIDLVVLCRDILDHRREPIAECGMPDEALVAADDLSVRRAVTNLVDNAVRHARTRTTLSLQRVGEHFTLHIDDDGDGVPPTDRDASSSGSPASTRPAAVTTAGPGLGLAIVAELAERFGGSVTLADSPIGGARFTLEIPAAERHDATLPAGPFSV